MPLVSPTLIASKATNASTAILAGRHEPEISRMSRFLGKVLLLGWCMPKTLGFVFSGLSFKRTLAEIRSPYFHLGRKLPDSRQGSSIQAIALLSSYRTGSSSSSSKNTNTNGACNGRKASTTCLAVSSSPASSSPVTSGDECSKSDHVADASVAGSSSKPGVIFVLGGPASGKGTQCKRLADEFGYVHLSAGELLRKERGSGSADGKLIDDHIREGRIVPVHISLGLLQRAMAGSGSFSRFLIDGFPRNSDNVKGWESIMGDVANVRRVLFLHCPENVLEKRLLSRGQSSGRNDDNLETAKRRFKTYVETTLPIIEDYERMSLVARVNGDQDVDTVFRDVVAALSTTREEEVLEANRVLVEAACREDWKTCSELCSSDISNVGLDQVAPSPVVSTQVRMLGGSAAIVTCERQGVQADGVEHAPMMEETRVWEIREGIWKCVHCHTSSLPPGPPSR